MSQQPHDLQQERELLEHFRQHSRASLPPPLMR